MSTQININPPCTMIKQRQLNIRINEDLYEMAQDKCYGQFGIGLSSLIKVFLRAFVSQRGIGFYVGDDDLCKLFSLWIMRKSKEKRPTRSRGSHIVGPRLRDIYDL